MSKILKKSICAYCEESNECLDFDGEDVCLKCKINLTEDEYRQAGLSEDDVMNAEVQALI